MPDQPSRFFLSEQCWQVTALPFRLLSGPPFTTHSCILWCLWHLSTCLGIMLDQSSSAVPALCAAEHSEMLCCRACWEGERCGDHSNKDIILWFCLPGEAPPVLNDLAAAHLCALLGCRHDHLTKAQTMIRLYLDIKTLFRGSGIVTVYSKFAYCICCVPFMAVPYSFVIHIPDSIKSVCMRQGDVQISLKNSLDEKVGGEK